MGDAYVRINGAQVVQARQLTKENAEELAEWCSGVLVDSQNPLDPEETFKEINVNHHGRISRLQPGWWLLKKGTTFFIASPPFFESMYEPIVERIPEAERPQFSDPFDGVPSIGGREHT